MENSCFATEGIVGRGLSFKNRQKIPPRKGQMQGTRYSSLFHKIPGYAQDHKFIYRFEFILILMLRPAAFRHLEYEVQLRKKTGDFGRQYDLSTAHEQLSAHLARPNLPLEQMLRAAALISPRFFAVQRFLLFGNKKAGVPRPFESPTGFLPLCQWAPLRSVEISTACWKVGRFSHGIGGTGMKLKEVCSTAS